jgi:hypothetical protein
VVTNRETLQTLVMKGSWHVEHFIFEEIEDVEVEEFEVLGGMVNKISGEEGGELKSISFFALFDCRWLSCSKQSELAFLFRDSITTQSPSDILIKTLLWKYLVKTKPKFLKYY